MTQTVLISYEGIGRMRRVGRIAFRIEGSKWVAYWTLLDGDISVDDAIWLGAIHMALVQDDARRRTFMELVQNAVLEIVPDMVGSPKHVEQVGLVGIIGTA
jgi:hypothetical protein